MLRQPAQNGELRRLAHRFGWNAIRDSEQGHVDRADHCDTAPSQCCSSSATVDISCIAAGCRVPSKEQARMATAIPLRIG